mgnify:CR=1 FL=1
MKKITFIGDITSDRPLLNAAYDRNTDAYDFFPVFGKVKKLFEESDYVVGNFETVCAGDKNGFQNQYLLCNSPDELIQAMVKGGVNCVTTANNHCLDQGIQPVVNFLLAKLALNAEIYMYDDWTQGYASRPKGSDIHFSVPASDASLRNGDKVDCRKLNAWETCIYYCDKLAEEGYVLESDDSFNFSTHNETSKENIFTIPMDKNIYTNQFHYLFRSYHYTHGGVLGWGSENGTCATISTMKANHYGEADEDARCKMNFVAGVVKVDGHELLMDNGKPLEYQPFEVAQNLTNSKFVKTAGARMAKYEVDRTSYMDGKLQSNDIVLFRYADVLLMKAEAKVRNGENGDEELNRIRARVGMPYRKATLDNILEERLLELVWEGWRRQDLIRFGKFTGAYDLRTPLQGESSGYTSVFPIPQKCIDLNSELIQNKGYVNILK